MKDRPQRPLGAFLLSLLPRLLRFVHDHHNAARAGSGMPAAGGARVELGWVWWTSGASSIPAGSGETRSSASSRMAALGLMGDARQRRDRADGLGAGSPMLATPSSPSRRMRPEPAKGFAQATRLCCADPHPRGAAGVDEFLHG